MNENGEKFSWVLITNPRAKREFDFLVQEVGEEKIIDARPLLGARKAFPLNLARVFGVKLPEHLQYLPRDEALERLKTMRQAFALRSASSVREARGSGPEPESTDHA